MHTKNGSKLKRIILVLFVQEGLWPFAFPHADMVLGGRSHVGWSLTLMMTGGSSKVCGGRRKKEERLDLEPRKSSNARKG